MGKTGGSSASRFLRNGCHPLPGIHFPCHDVENESILSIRTTGYYHVRDFPATAHDGFIVTVRDPVERVISLWNYRHTANVDAVKDLPRQRTGAETMLYKCFRLVNELAEALTAEPRSKCASMAWRAVTGVNSLINHLHWNYGKMTNDIPDDAVVFLLRVEALWSDFGRINVLLGGPDVSQYLRELDTRTREYHDLVVDSKALSGVGLHNLCVALRKEYHYYRRLIRLAVNVDGARDRCAGVVQ